MIDLNKRNMTFQEIVEAQAFLNTKADPNNPDWVSIRTNEDFKLATVIEFVELIESAPWKWWKKSDSIDWWNIKIEAIDMLHFLTSNIYLNGINEEDKNKHLGYGNEEEINKFLFNESIIDRKKAVKILALLLEEETFDIINEVMKSVGLLKDEISAIYIAKYTLNEIRWEGGYLYGNYIKMKENGLEDNYFLKEIVDDFKNNSEKNLKDIQQEVIQKLS